MEGNQPPLWAVWRLQFLRRKTNWNVCSARKDLPHPCPVQPHLSTVRESKIKTKKNKNMERSRKCVSTRGTIFEENFISVLCHLFLCWTKLTHISTYGAIERPEFVEKNFILIFFVLNYTIIAFDFIHTRRVGDGVVCFPRPTRF